jgi:hypothetical protein
MELLLAMQKKMDANHAKRMDTNKAKMKSVAGHGEVHNLIPDAVTVVIPPPNFWNIALSYDIVPMGNRNLHYQILPYRLFVET